MKKVGIVGGMGPESTLEYYKSIVYKYQKLSEKEELPKIVIDSVDMFEMLELCEKKDYLSLREFVLESINNLYRAGAEVGVISSNTPHIIFEEVEKLSPIPLISIVNETFKKVKESKLDRVGLIGTKFTMGEDFYKNIFRVNGISIEVPEAWEQDYINSKIYKELEYGIINEETKKKVIEIIYSMKSRCNVNAVILGCTELPLLIKDEDVDIKLFNTTDIHINSVVDYILK